LTCTTADGQDFGGQGVVYAADKPDHVSATRSKCQLFRVLRLAHRYAPAMTWKRVAQQKKVPTQGGGTRARILGHWLLACPAVHSKPRGGIPGQM
jgi:hypothetical protein